ncbi:MAG: hypothetical protein OXG39_19360 [Chloroflexi bacterium]|nr:hypothetical protein [Chloroflexota bacterium]
MIRFFGKIGLIVLPLMVVTLGLSGLAWHTGEALPIADVVSRQQLAKDIIFGTRMLEDIMPYKLSTYKKRQPQILILGSSQLLQFRAEFFSKDPDAVYNASGGGWRLPQLIQFYQQLETLPAIVILGVDLFWFNAQVEQVSRATSARNVHSGLEGIRLGTIETVHKLLGGDLSFADMIRRRDPVFDRQVIGLKALEISFGFRADGSLQRGLLVANPRIRAERVESDIRRFEGLGFSYTAGDQLNNATLDLLSGFLDHLDSDGVEVIGITTPYHFDIYEKMQQSGAYSYMEKAVPRLEELFSLYKFPYYFFGDMREWGAAYEEWYDGHHSAESNSLRMILAMIEDHAELFVTYADHQAINDLLRNFENPMDVFGEYQS